MDGLALQSDVNQAMRFRSRRHFAEWRRPLSNGVALASASRLASRSRERYLLVVLTLTCPNQWAIVLRSTPERSRWVAVLCLIECGCSRLCFREGRCAAAFSTYFFRIRRIPNRVKRPPRSLRNTGADGLGGESCCCRSRCRSPAVSGQIGHILSLRLSKAFDNRKYGKVVVMER